MFGIILIIVLIILYFYYKPYVDITEDSVILWYNSKGSRNYKVLWSKNNIKDDY